MKPFSGNSANIWLSLHFYQLPMDVFVSDKKQPYDNKTAKEEVIVPFAIVENFRLIYCNPSAQEYGLTSNMKVATAYALCANLMVKERNHALESKNLLELANIAYEFSSQVCLYDEKSILLEIKGSNKLFVSIKNLLNLLQEKLQRLAINYSSAMAETPKQSFLLSLYNQEKPQAKQLINIEPTLLKSRQSIKNISIDFIAKDISDNKRTINLQKNILKTKKMGIKQIGELMDLPDSALGRRFGKNFLTYLYRLQGKLNDPLKLYSIAEEFCVQRCFLSGLDSVEQILFPARPMLESLISFLNLRRKMASKITWRFVCFNRDKISISLLLSSQVQTTHQLMNLTHLKLQHIEIKEKIEMIYLEVNHFLSKDEQQKSFTLSDPSNKQSSIQTKESLDALQDKLHARLGQGSYLRLTINNEHLPEKRSSLYFVQEQSVKPNSINMPIENSPHPLWLMDTPVKINTYLNHSHLQLNYKGELDICSKTNKFETFWWSENKETTQKEPFNNISKRDYFIAKTNKNTVLYWIFHDQKLDEWFVHGVF